MPEINIAYTLKCWLGSDRQQPGGKCDSEYDCGARKQAVFGFTSRRTADRHGDEFA